MGVGCESAAVNCGLLRFPGILIDTQTATDTVSKDGIRFVNVTKFLGELV